MQSAASSISTQSDILKSMQPQPAQNMYVPSSGANNTGNVRTNQQTGALYRGPPASSATRAARHLQMQPMYQQTMHQGVVVPAYTQFPRQAFQTPQYSFPQPIQQNYYPYHYINAIQQPQTHQQRGAVGVNTGVGSAHPVQNSPNGPLTGPSGATQAQIPITSGTVLTSAVPPGSNSVLGVTTSTTGQQIGVTPMVGVVQAGHSAQPTPTTNRRRRHALEIIHPETKKNILDEYDNSKNSGNSENDYTDQISTSAAIQPETIKGTPQQDHSNIGISGGILVMTETRPSMLYPMDIHQISQPRDIVGQTPIVSAMSDAPSVEILPTPQKPRNRKILAIVPPKEDHNIAYTASKTAEDFKPQQSTIKSLDDPATVKTHCVQQPLPQHYQIIQVPQTNISQQISGEAQIATANFEQMLDNTAVSDPDSDIISKDVERTSESVADIPTNTTTSSSIDWCKVAIDSNQIDKQLPPSAASTSSIRVVESSTCSTESSETKSESTPLRTELQRSLHTMHLNENEITPKAVSKIDLSTVISTTNGTASSSTGEEELIKIDISNVSVELENNKANNKENNVIQEKNTIQESMICDETDRAIPTQQLTHESPIPQEISQTENRLDTEYNIKQSSGDRVETNNDDNTAETNKSVPNNNNNTIESTISVVETPGNTSTPINPTTASVAFIEAQPLINYNEGQWSPNNPTGKRQYDRGQLMLLREAKASRIQPEVNNVSILPQPNLMPSFVRNNNKRVQSMGGGSISGNNNRSGEGGGSSFSKGSMPGVHARNSMKATAGMIHVNLSLNQDVKLNETDNAWRPRVLVKGGNEVDVNPQGKTLSEKDDLIRRVRGILNKLTPEKFDALVEEIIKLKIDTPDKMEDVMVLVFEKAIDEPNFSVSYARLCHRLITEVKARDERMESGTKSNLAHFRNALLDKTEREFTQNVVKTQAKEKRLQPIIFKIKKCPDPVEKAELEAQLEEEERKIRRRSGGTVRFIGELFKISMLTGKIIQCCIEKLLNPDSEDMLECMCKLITTVGAKFEQTPLIAKDPSRCYTLEKNIARMQAIASKTDKDGAKVSSRVRFMLQDVIDLRKNKWQSTRNEAPKTMEQIEKEAKTEQLSSQYLNYGISVSGGGGSGSNGPQTMSGKRDDRGGGRYGDNRSGGGYNGSHSQRGDSGTLRRQNQGGSGGNNNTGSGHSNGNNDDSTWHVQTSKGSRSLAVDTNKLEGLHNPVDGTKKLGGASQFIWNNAALRQSSTPTTTPSNSFAVLSSLVDSNKSNDRGLPRNKGSYNKSSMERENYGDRNMHSRTGSSQASRENSSSRGSQGGRGMMNPSMQKSTSHSKYSQQIPSSRTSSKPSGLSSGSSTLYPHHRDQPLSQPFASQHHQPDSLSSNALPSVAPAAIFEQPSETDLKLIKAVISEMIEIDVNSKTINSSVITCINRIKDNQRCGLLYHILTEYLHLRDVGQIQRRCLANIVVYLIKHNSLSVEHFQLSYVHFCELASDLIVDIPGLWLYIFEFTGPLITQQMITINDLWTKELKEDSSPSLGQKFLKTYLTYCTREIGPSFTRNMWKKCNMKWTDFVAENDVKNFIQSNKLEYIESESISPEIEVKEPRENHIIRVVEHIDHMLKEGSNADAIIDYINGNIVEIEKPFIRSLTTTLCNFTITYKDSCYKLDTDCFRNICIPILHRYIDSKEERELECLYSMQLLIHSLEHPRALLGEMFVELYNADVIPQDSFFKWRDSKDQSAGKGVAVKGLNQFFNSIRGETDDENN